MVVLVCCHLDACVTQDFRNGGEVCPSAQEKRCKKVPNVVHANRIGNPSPGSRGFQGAAKLFDGPTFVFDKEVFNGDLGRITRIDQEAQVVYEFTDLDELI